ncbi:hypothetical protein LguiA_015568 [Lonicera macranthoides]
MNVCCIQLPPHSLFRSPSTRLLISFHKSPRTSAPILRITASTIQPRDRVLDFGKHKGKMLGTLPSNYLKWVSNNLRTQDFEHWAKLADQVLEDPIYRDRIEWEYADRLLSGGGNVSMNSDGNGVSNQLLELSQRFGWDFEDEVGWSKINFGLLGTSKGGRIPRVCERREGGEEELRAKTDKARKEKRVVSEGRVKRRERRERMRSKSVGWSGVQVSEQPLEKRLGSEEMRRVDDEIKEDRVADIRSRFPGRQSLLEKALSRRRR